MMVVLLATALLLIIFQTNINTASATNKTTGQSLDESLIKLQQNIQRLTVSIQDLEHEYTTTKKEVNGLRKLQESCAPCEAKENGVCDCTVIGKPRKDCLEFYQQGYKIDGVYRLQKGSGSRTVFIFCDQNTDGGGWTVFQRRQDGSVDFNRKWNDYKRGFGRLNGEFWFGNENIHDLTKLSFSPKKSQLLIKMRMKGQKDTVYAKYNTFEVTDEKSKYVLKIHGFSGNTSDSRNWLNHNNNRKFTTIDSDNDSWEEGNCAADYGDDGGWWYGICSQTYLNGRYKFTKRPGEISWRSRTQQPEFVEMKMRRNL